MYKSIRNHSYITFIWTFITQTNFLISKQDLNIDFCSISTCLILGKTVIVGIIHTIMVRGREWVIVGIMHTIMVGMREWVIVV
jgi:hypothetical protein